MHVPQVDLAVTEESVLHERSKLKMAFSERSKIRPLPPLPLSMPSQRNGRTAPKTRYRDSPECYGRLRFHQPTDPSPCRDRRDAQADGHGHSKALAGPDIDLDGNAGETARKS